MYLKDIKDKDTYNNLKLGCCMNCGLLPEFTAELKGNAVVTTISYKANLGWTFLINDDKSKITHCYCPVCTRKIKLLKLKSKL